MGSKSTSRSSPTSNQLAPLDPADGELPGKKERATVERGEARMSDRTRAASGAVAWRGWKPREERRATKWWITELVWCPTEGEGGEHAWDLPWMSSGLR